MKTHEEIISRLNKANPLSNTEMITDGQLAELTVQIEQERRAAPDPGDRAGVAQQEPAARSATDGRRTRWLRPAVAFASALLLVLAVFGIAALLRPNQPDVADQPPPAPATTVAMTTTPATTAPGASAVAPERVNQVRSLAVATDGSLWAATAGGLVRWDLSTQTPTIYTSDDGLPAGGFSFVEAGPDGTVWTGGPGWMARFDGSWTTFAVPHKDPMMPVAVGPDGSVWSVTGPQKLGRFDGSAWQVFESPFGGSEPEFWASSLAVAPDGTVWAGLDGVHAEDPRLSTVSGGAASFDGTDWTRYTTADGLPDRVGNFVTVAPDGTVWAGSAGFSWVDGSDSDGSTPGGGAARFDGTTWTGFTTSDGLPSDDVEITVGADGSVWGVSIFSDGVARFDGAGWTLFPDVPGVGGSVDTTGTLWRSATDADGGIVGFDGIETIRLVVPFDESTTTASPTTTIVPPAGDWNPILAETRAKDAPAAATCPEGTDPNTPGPAAQNQPEVGWAGVQAGAFDSRTGRILYVDASRQTWTFDVCTNTWHEMNATGAPGTELSGGLVYDVDSDVTVALGFSDVSVYDANTNSWTRLPDNFIGTGIDQTPPFGGVYDPVSGLIVTTNLTDEYVEIWAYDVDSNTGTPVGRVGQLPGDDYTWLELLGYSRGIDRLIFGSVSDVTALVDPRTGETTLITTATPGIDLGWPMAQYGPAADTAYVAVGTWVDGGVFSPQFPEEICGFDPGTSAWTSCFAMPGGTRYSAFAAMVGDPISNRLVLIHGVYGDWWANGDSVVWAIDLETGETTELVAPTDR
ncbi:MAG: hypothetical protein DRJ50_13895 [Actinobacteria bacterium]|nr:MAG: hypothetical protein DRJ50_13895 [Actinomycetota bacterium]